ncbi:signal peptidase II [Brevibacterium sp. 91QC2O2]|uniref:signal peptidase II n=1 Tax=Brevibacterium TaxID=1696 RepID=UPI00211BF4B2|nr:signal peptidase II [Brevibacterium sp. 91QC2O2]MCQ9384161.1 signal peptidase II [Brevibacterium sp. 68QC2CO]
MVVDKQDGARIGRPRIWLFAVALLVVLADQATKALAVAFLAGRPRVPVLGDLAGLTFLRNPGAALGLGSNTTWLFAVIAIIVFAAILISVRRLRSVTWGAGLGLLLGGLVGNLIDRLFRAPGVFHGAVVDFIDLYFFVCNVADIAITGAAVLIIIASLKGIPFGVATHSDHAQQEVDPV